MTVGAHRRRGGRVGSMVSIALLGTAIAAGTLELVPSAYADTSTRQNHQNAHRARPDGVNRVTATDDGVRVAGTAAPDSAVRIHALGTEQDTDAWRRTEPVAEVRAGADGTFDAAVQETRSAVDPYYAKYVAVSDGTVLGSHHYVDDNRVTPINDYPYPRTQSIKGLQVQMTDDAEELGNQHAAVNVALDSLLQLKNEGAQGTIVFESGGREFFFDREVVRAHDRTISSLSDTGQVVNLILLAYNNTDQNSAASKLIHPDAELTAGTVFGFDTVTAEGVAYYTAAVRFLTQRYTRTDQAHGRAVGFIVGNEVDAQWTWANMGEKPLSDFLRDYERALRITAQAARAAYGNARVYTSLTHSFNTPAMPDPSGGLRYYPGRAVLDGLNELTKAHGDYPWNVAHHPYPEDLTDPAFWLDETATTDPETTERITFENIELLPAYLDRPELKYAERSRRIILSEQGCNTPDESAESQQLQAACYVAAYYKVRFAGDIDAFILHRHVDHKEEGGLRLGLWTWNDDHPEPSSPYQRKPIHDVFRAIDTEDSLAATEFAKPIIGIDNWSELIPDFDPTALAERETPFQAEAERGGEPVDPQPISGFDSGTDGWQQSHNANAVSAADGLLSVSFDELATRWRGTKRSFEQPPTTGEHPWLTVLLRPGDASTAGAREVQLRAYAGDTAVARAVVPLADNADPQRVSMNLSGWDSARAITRVEVWLRGSTHTDWSGTYQLDQVALASDITE